jgi:outer membrane cobalamin receptor
LSGSLVGRRVDSDFSSLVPPMTENERFGLWSLRGSVQLARAIAVTGAIDNLTDSDHMDPLGYPALGRGGRIGLRVKW